MYKKGLVPWVTLDRKSNVLYSTQCLTNLCNDRSKFSSSLKIEESDPKPERKQTKRKMNIRMERTTETKVDKKIKRQMLVLRQTRLNRHGTTNREMDRETSLETNRIQPTRIRIGMDKEKLKDCQKE